MDLSHIELTDIETISRFVSYHGSLQVININMSNCKISSYEFNLFIQNFFDVTDTANSSFSGTILIKASNQSLLKVEKS